MANRFDHKRRGLSKRRDELVREYDIVTEQLIIEIDAVKCKRLQDQLDKIQKQIDEIDLQLEEIEEAARSDYSGSTMQNDENMSGQDNDSSQMFQITYQLVHPYILEGEDALVQALVSFSSRKDMTKPKRKIQTHLCLILDVSGSMNTPQKYPLLLQAIPVLIQVLADEDYLTIILFSSDCHVVLCDTPIAEVRDNIVELLNRINSSGIVFGYNTFLATALDAAITEISEFRQAFPMAINRLYILTDGELHDLDACVAHNPQLRALETEVHSYGFGSEFALDSMLNIMEGIPGGTVKPIFDTHDIEYTFGHIGDLSQRVIAQDGQFTFRFSPDIIAGDAFRYQPGTRYFGSVDVGTKTFEIPLGALEQDRVYTFAFEGRVPKSAKFGRLSLGVAELTYHVNRNAHKVTKELYIERTSNQQRAERVTKTPQRIFSILEAFRDDNPETQLESLRARIEIYQREGADPMLIDIIKQSIVKLERGEPLNETEKRGVCADLASQLL